MNLDNFHIQKIGNSYIFEGKRAIKHVVDFIYDLTSKILYVRSVWNIEWQVASIFYYERVIETIEQYVRTKEFRLELQKVLSE